MTGRFCAIVWYYIVDIVGGILRRVEGLAESSEFMRGCEGWVREAIVACVREVL